jgi:CO dehydrogenase maturation factor
MKIAFVGKGGSGKSTMTSLFIRYLESQNKRGVMAIDADLNMNLAGLLGVSVPDDIILSKPDVADKIRMHLKGHNPLIADHTKFLPTTPPGPGSNMIRTANDAAMAPYAVQVSPNLSLMTVGTYDREGIGQSCYHTNLFVAENILSHTVAGDSLDVVCDMVAGTDAFAYSLHLQFDAIVLIVEPTPESAEVCALYMGLAQEAGIDGLIHLVGNKIEDADDVAFIVERTGRTPLGTVPLMPVLKKSRQRGSPVTPEMLDGPIVSVMQAVERAAQNPAIPAGARMEKLCALHQKLAVQDWVMSGYGDVANQIDTSFLKQAV